MPNIEPVTVHADVKLRKGKLRDLQELHELLTNAQFSDGVEIELTFGQGETMEELVDQVLEQGEALGAEEPAAEPVPAKSAAPAKNGKPKRKKKQAKRSKVDVAKANMKQEEALFEAMRTAPGSKLAFIGAKFYSEKKRKLTRQDVEDCVRMNPGRSAGQILAIVNAGREPEWRMGKSTVSRHLMLLKKDKLVTSQSGRFKITQKAETNANLRKLTADPSPGASGADALAAQV